MTSKVKRTPFVTSIFKCKQAERGQTELQACEQDTNSIPTGYYLHESINQTTHVGNKNSFLPQQSMKRGSQTNPIKTNTSRANNKYTYNRMSDDRWDNPIAAGNCCTRSYRRGDSRLMQCHYRPSIWHLQGHATDVSTICPKEILVHIETVSRYDAPSGVCRSNQCNHFQ